ncbi:MAG: ATP-binding protein [Bacteroidales bacterium]
MKTSQLYLTNKISELEKLRDFMEHIGAHWHIPSSVGMSVNLALEEAFANIVNHAFTDNKAHEIRFFFQMDGDQLVISITDDGQQFDPTKKEPPDLDLPAEERPIGGLGIYLIQKIMDRVEYNRIDHTNQLTLTKRIKQ